MQILSFLKKQITMREYLCPQTNGEVFDGYKDIYVNWLTDNLVLLVNEYIEQEKLSQHGFILCLGNKFKTPLFEKFIKKWLIIYMQDLYMRLICLSYGEADVTST